MAGLISVGIVYAAWLLGYAIVWALDPTRRSRRRPPVRPDAAPDLTAKLREIQDDHHARIMEELRAEQRRINARVHQHLPYERVGVGGTNGTFCATCGQAVDAR